MRKILQAVRLPVWIVTGLVVWALAGCSPAVVRPTAAPTEPPPTQTLAAAEILAAETPSAAVTQPAKSPAEAVHYQTIMIPGPGNASLELPEDWKFWGNGGWLSPDGGQTLGGLRLVFQKPGQDAGKLLFNEGAVLIDQSPVTVKDVKMTRYKIQSFLTNAATGQRVLEGYELIYAIPLDKGGLLAGVFVRTPAQEDLAKWEPVVEHMAESLKVAGE